MARLKLGARDSAQARLVWEDFWGEIMSMEWKKPWYKRFFRVFVVAPLGIDALDEWII